MKILIIAAHMDDEVLGCGGTICKYIDEGHEVAILYVCGRAYFNIMDRKSLKREEKCAEAVCDFLNISQFNFLRLHDEQLDHRVIDVVKPIEKEISLFKPDIIFTNHRGDNHQDHQVVFKATMIATRTMAEWQPKKIYSYEVLSSTEQSPKFDEFSFQPNVYINIEKYIEQKLEAFKLYQYEMYPFPHPRSIEGISSLAMYRGMSANYKYAEAFVLIKELIF